MNDNNVIDNGEEESFPRQAMSALYNREFAPGGLFVVHKQHSLAVAFFFFFFLEIYVQQVIYYLVLRRTGSVRMHLSL